MTDYKPTTEKQQIAELVQFDGSLLHAMRLLDWAIGHGEQLAADATIGHGDARLRMHDGKQWHYIDKDEYLVLITNGDLQICRTFDELSERFTMKGVS